MKIILILFILCPMFLFGQTQIGEDLKGKSPFNKYGYSVGMSSDGNTIAIGAPYNEPNNGGVGYVRLFRNINNKWSQIGQEILDNELYSHFGFSIDLSLDGNIVAIGAPHKLKNGIHTGQVRIYKNESGNWIQIGQDINGDQSQSRFGHSLSLSSDGNIIAIGAPQKMGSGFVSGQVRIYKNESGNWTQIGQDINGEGTNSHDQSGASVVISSDGGIVAIGAPTNGNSGHVRIFKNNLGTWTQIGNDIDGEEIGDYSGKVSLSSDGSIIAIGAWYNDGNGNNSGHVRVFKNNSGIWTQIGNDIDGEAEGDLFGTSVSLSSNGNIIAIGAIENDYNSNNSGQVRIFKNESGNWIQIGYSINGEAEGDLFGFRVKLSSNGQNLVIGAPFKNSNGTKSGLVKVYDLNQPLSTENFILNNSFKIKPNPATNQISIELENLIFKKLSVYNTLGQLVKTSSIKNINISNFSKGIYFVEVETNKGKVSKKLIIE